MRQLTLLLAMLTMASGQSFLNSQGLGEMTGPGDARRAGTGDPWALSLANPGMLVRLNHTSFSVSALGSAVIGTAQGASRIVGTGRPAALDVAAPLPLRFSLFAGVNERFNQDFDVWSESLADTAYRRHVVARGGIYALRAGLAKSLFDRFCLGAGYVYLLGGTREDWRFEVSDGEYTSVDTIEADYSAHTFELGASGQFSTLALAALYRPATSMAVNRYLRVHGAVSDSQQNITLTLPHSLHFGAGVSPMSGLALSVGLDLFPWSSATFARDTAAAQSLSFTDTRRISLGVEYDVAPGYPVRAGYSFGNAYYTMPVHPYQVSTSVPQNCLHLGTSIPVPKFGSLDLALELTQRKASSLSEVCARLTLTLAYREPWGRRTRRWGY